MKCSIDKCPVGMEEAESVTTHLQACVERHREAAAHIVAHLREGVRRVADLSFIREPQRRAALKEIEHVLELSKIAEAKFEGLISRWGGGW